MSEEMTADWKAIAEHRLRLLDEQDAEHGKQAAEIERLQQVAILEGIERKSALATARQAIAKAGRAAELEDEIERLRAALRCRTRQRIAAEGEVYVLRKLLGMRAEPVCADPSRKPN